MAKVWTCTSVNERLKIKLLLEFEMDSRLCFGLLLLFVLEKDWVFFHIGTPVDLAKLVTDPNYVDDQHHQGCHSCKQRMG